MVELQAFACSPHLSAHRGALLVLPLHWGTAQTGPGKDAVLEVNSKGLILQCAYHLLNPHWYLMQE